MYSVKETMPESSAGTVHVVMCACFAFTVLGYPGRRRLGRYPVQIIAMGVCLAAILFLII